MNNLRRLDMNQLLTLQILLSEKHVSRAAKKLNKSQPAVSHALNQLREIFQDPLLLRENGRYILSTKALSLYQPLSQALQDLSALLHQGKFFPESSQRHFRLAMSDYGCQLLLPKLLTYLQKTSPLISIEVCSCTRDEMQLGLLEGKFDLAFGVFHRIHPELDCETLWNDAFICLVDEKHPILQTTNTKIGLDQWLAFPHISIGLKAYDAGEIEEALANINLQRNISYTLPYWQVASHLLHNTNLILTIAAKTLITSKLENIQTFSAPLSLPDIHFQMLSHPRAHNDEALSWLKEWFKQ